MSRVIRRTMLVLVLFLQPAAAWSQREDFGRPGTYFGVNFVYAVEDFDNSGRVDVDDAPGFNLLLGQRLNANFTVDVQWEYIDDFEFDLDNSDLDGEIEIHMLSLNGRLYLTTTRVQPFVKAGFGFMHADARAGIFGDVGDDDAFAVRGGGGLDFYLTENVVISAGAEYVVPTSDLEDFRYVSVQGGLQYRF